MRYLERNMKRVGFPVMVSLHSFDTWIDAIAVAYDRDKYLTVQMADGTIEAVKTGYVKDTKGRHLKFSKLITLPEEYGQTAPSHKAIAAERKAVRLKPYDVYQVRDAEYKLIKKFRHSAPAIRLLRNGKSQQWGMHRTRSFRYASISGLLCNFRKDGILEVNTSQCPNMISYKQVRDILR